MRIKIFLTENINQLLINK